MGTDVNALKIVIYARAVKELKQFLILLMIFYGQSDVYIFDLHCILNTRIQCPLDKDSN